MQLILVILTTELHTIYVAGYYVTHAIWPKKGNFYAWLYMGCGYPTIDINYANYICAISVSLA